MLLPLRFWADVFSPVPDISTVCLISRADVIALIETLANTICHMYGMRHYTKHQNYN